MKFSLSPFRLYRLLILLFLIAGARRVTFTIDAVRDMDHEYAAQSFSVRSPWPTVNAVSRAASESGLRPGDRILTVAGHPPDGRGDLAAAFHSLNAGQTAAVTVARGGQTLTLAVKPRIVEFGSNCAPPTNLRQARRNTTT